MNDFNRKNGVILSSIDDSIEEFRYNFKGDFNWQGANFNYYSDYDEKWSNIEQYTNKKFNLTLSSKFLKHPINVKIRYLEYEGDGKPTIEVKLFDIIRYLCDIANW